MNEVDFLLMVDENVLSGIVLFIDCVIFIFFIEIVLCCFCLVGVFCVFFCMVYENWDGLVFFYKKGGFFILYVNIKKVY